MSVFSRIAADVLLLTMGLGADHPSPAYRDPVGEDPRRAGNLVADHLHDLVDPSAVEGMALLDQDQQLGENGSRLLHCDLVALEHDLVSTRDEAHLREMILDLTEMTVGIPK